MRIGFVVNSVATEHVDYTTTGLAMTAAKRGHEVWYVGVGDFSHGPNEYVHARAVTAPKTNYRSRSRFLGDIQSKRAVVDTIAIDDLDVLMLRNDPAEDMTSRPWARLAGINFGRLALRHGVIVLNDPDGLNHAINKIYLQQFPESVRPRTLVSRNKDDLKAFISEQGGFAVLKPLTGSGGRNVFQVSPEDHGNVNQMIEAVLRDGYVIAQEYLPGAVHGDTRVFMMNGRLLTCKGKVAAICRVRPVDDIRSNMTIGGTVGPAGITDDIHRLAGALRPRLIQDGLFLVGMDVVGDKLMEINVFSPGGLHSAGQLSGVNFLEQVLIAIERKMDYVGHHHDIISNAELATL